VLQGTTDALSAIDPGARAGVLLVQRLATGVESVA